MNIDEALDFLNYYRNCHYTDSSDTEEYKLAQAINSILPDYCALRAQQEAEKNEPLTLDELREMDGKPVWIMSAKEDGKIPARYMLASDYYADRDLYLYQPDSGLTQGYQGRSYRKTWLAYRHKPKEE